MTSSARPSRMATQEGHASHGSPSREVGAVDGLGQDPRHATSCRCRAGRRRGSRGRAGPARTALRSVSTTGLLADDLGRTSGPASGGRGPGGGVALRVVGGGRPWAAVPGRRALRGRPAGTVRVPCTLRRSRPLRAPDRSERLGPGRSAAPGEQRLTLLPSGPDVVHASPLRGTRSSTSIAPSASADADLGRGFSPAGADCRYRAPLVPRLARPGNDSRPAVRSGKGGGEGGIRTHDELPHTAFPVRRPRPLGDLSGMARARARHGPGRRRDGGGEGGIRTHGAFAHRFSRAAPSTTRTPLRGRV